LWHATSIVVFGNSRLQVRKARRDIREGGLAMLGLSMNKSIKTTLILIAFLLALSTHSLAGQFKVTKVYDGDTIMAEGHDIIIYVLLAGIDGPEIGSRKQQRGQPYGQEAKKYLEKLILNKTVDIKGYGLGPYPFNHLIGEIYLKDIIRDGAK